MEKINIAELLKDCPKGMELDCALFNKPVKFDGIDKDYDLYPIRVKIEDNTEWFDKYGCNNSKTYAKCVIYPKGKTTWEGFVPPIKFKDGDVISNDVCICIYNGNENDKYYGSYVSIGHIDFPNYFINRTENNYFTKENAYLATEEEKQKLFDAIKSNGYKWNAETKTLEQLIEPKFKVGDRIKKGEEIATIVRIYKNCYKVKYDNGTGAFSIDLQDEWELVPNKFDINTLVPFESKVLVRDGLSYKWLPAIWGFYNEDGCDYHYEVVGGNGFSYCIPYEGNEHLRGTTDDCSDYYKTWE